jgi:hypothetical protein
VLALWAMPGTVTATVKNRTNSGKAYLVAVKVSFWDGATTWLVVDGLAMAPANGVGPPAMANRRRNALIICMAISKNAECAF